MSQNLQNFAIFQKFQLVNLVDFEKCCQTHIFLQKSVPIQPKTSNILPKICQKLATTLRVVFTAAAPRLVLGELDGRAEPLEHGAVEDHDDGPETLVERFDVEPFPDFSPK